MPKKTCTLALRNFNTGTKSVYVGYVTGQTMIPLVINANMAPGDTQRKTGLTGRLLHSRAKRGAAGPSVERTVMKVV